MEAGEFCVVCGATGRPLVNGVCPDCAADRSTLVTAPARAEVTVCPHCGARQVSKHWERHGSSPVLTAEDLAPFLTVHPEAGLRRIRWEETQSSATVRELIGRAHLSFRGVIRDIEVPLSVRVVSRSCPDCSRKSGKYYTALLQLRGPTERLSEKPPALRARLALLWKEIMEDAQPAWRRAVSWREELPEGWDCYFTDTMAARSVARLAKQHFGASMVESASLFGRKDGRDVYRVTFCLRFPRSSPEPPPTGGRGSRARRLEQ
ncbi:MAG TPA: 60S ribosomal export protein NMD3 [Thermoplasmata archaeon]|nr:60S ribosomal export protein NMD3 [Thermoplasmata archaeon]